jgi:DNA helicase-2/ATP-dependent DNA helicase PcrA
MDSMADLTAAQREAVTHTHGALLVLAGAGSGKTRVITRRVAHLLSSGIHPDQVLALTFTNKAATEMRERIEALAPESRVWVGTFHGFCARMLRKYSPLVGIDTGFSIYDQNDRLRAIKSVMEIQGTDDSQWTPERLEAAISRAKNDLLSPDVLKRQAFDRRGRVLAEVYAGYEERLRQTSSVDFDDLLVHLVAILKDHKDVRAQLDARFRYVLVDEYQDTNLAQYAIVRALSRDHPNICVTGDPDQSIYGWRGANLANILEFEKDFPGCKVVTLDRNYRSTQNIIQVADHLIQFNRNRKPKALRTENPVGEPVELTIYDRENDEAEGVAAAICSLAEGGELRFADIAVFCRVTALTRPFEQAFRVARIPYQIVGGVAFYERQEVKDVLAYLNLVINPKDDLAFMRVVNVPPRGLGKTSLDHLALAARQANLPLLAMARRARSIPALKDKAARAFEEFVRVIDELVKAREQPAAEVTSKVLQATGYREHLEEESRGGEDRLANLDELIEAACEFDQAHPGAPIQGFLSEVTLASAIDRWNPDTGAVTLMTLHAAKGLEFPVVFIVGLEQGLLPHSRSQGNHSELEEERRLFFVGITRARRRLYLSQCVVRSFRGQQQSTTPSEFLRELPEGPILIRDLSGVGRAEPRFAPIGTWPARRSEPRPAPAAQEFRMTTAADLAKPASVRFGSAKAAPRPGELDRFQPGITVMHPEYGLGRIVSIEGAGNDRKGRVAFAVGPPRTFVLSKSPLKVVPRSGQNGLPR